MDAVIGIDIETLIKGVGLLGLFAVVFAESGLFIGFFLPGDSLLFTAGFLASQGYFSGPLLMAGCFVAAVLGDNAGYAFGRRVGPRIFTREDSRLFRKSHLEKARIFFERHGGKTIILARFLPVIRTFAPMLAGAGKMNYKAFFLYNVTGGFLWGTGLTGLGYFLGTTIPHLGEYIAYVIVGIGVISALPPLIHILKEKEHRHEIKRIALNVLMKLKKEARSKN